MNQTKYGMRTTKAINEAEQQYEPLSQQIYDELIKEIDRLFDALKNDLVQISGLNWEWQKTVIKHGNALNESVVPVSLFALVESKKLLNELRYALREDASTIKRNQVIELYRDKLKELVKKSIFRPKSLSPEEIYKQNQKWRKNPALQQGMNDFLSSTNTQLGHSMLAKDREQLEKERKEFEDLKRGTSGPKGTPGTDPKLNTSPTTPSPTPTTPPQATTPTPPAPKPAAPSATTTPTPTAPKPATTTATTPPAPPKVDPVATPTPKAEPAATPTAPPVDPMATASPDIIDPKERLKVIKIGLLVNQAIMKFKNKQVTPEQVEQTLKLFSPTGKLDDMDVTGMFDGPKEEKFLKLGQGYLALHGGGAVGELDTGKEPYTPPPQAEKTVDELVAMNKNKMVDYLVSVAGADAVEEVKKEFRGSVPNVPENKKIFIEKVLAKKPKKESVEPISIVKQLRLNLRNGVKPRIRLEGVDNKVEYIKSMLRK